MDSFITTGHGSQVWVCRAPAPRYGATFAALHRRGSCSSIVLPTWRASHSVQNSGRPSCCSCWIIAVIRPRIGCRRGNHHVRGAKRGLDQPDAGRTSRPPLSRRQAPRADSERLGRVLLCAPWNASFISSWAQVSSFASYCTSTVQSRKCRGCPARYADPTAARAYPRGTGGQRRGYSSMSAQQSGSHTLSPRAPPRLLCCPAPAFCRPGIRLVAGENRSRPSGSAWC